MHVMDNTADNPYNPFPGKVFSYPTGEELYQYAKDNFDYKGGDNTKDVFLKVITGVDPGVGSGRVLNTTDDDIVFISTISHGSPGAWYFLGPGGTVAMHASEFKDAIDKIKAKKIIIYFNSCYSGSFFDGLYPKDGRVIALTGAGPTTEGNCCCMNMTGSHHFWMDSCFHTRWQLDSREQIKDKKMESVTIQDQFDDIQKIKTEEDVFCLYGNLDEADKVTLSEFQGVEKDGIRSSARRKTNDDNSCVKDPNTRNKASMPSLFTKTAERDEQNRQIWSSFREKLGLEDTPEGNDYCHPHGAAVEYPDCLKDAYDVAFDKCNYFSVYEKKNGINLVQACNQMQGNSEVISHVLTEICGKMKIEKEYVIE